MTADRASRRLVRGRPRPGGGLAGLRGLWRVSVVEGSMAPAVLPGDWLLVDPTVSRWPRRGTIVVFREPFTDLLAIKRVAARPGDWVPFADGWLQLADDEAWLLGDADDDAVAAAGHGTTSDSRRYGPPNRIGRPDPAPADLLARGRTAAMPNPTSGGPVIRPGA